MVHETCSSAPVRGVEGVSIVWRARGDLNPGPPAPEAGALLLAELRALGTFIRYKLQIF